MTRGADLLRVRLEAQALGGVQRDELRELDAVLEFFRGLAVHRGDADQGVELLAGGLLAAVLAFTRCTDGTDDGVALAQVVLLHLGEGDVDVVRARQVAGGADERVVLQHVQDTGDGQQDVVLGDLDVVDVRPLDASPAAVVAVAEAVVARGVVAAVLPARALGRSLRSRRFRRFRRLPPSLSSLSRLSGCRGCRQPRRGRRGVRVPSRRWPSSLPCSAWRCSVRCSMRCSVRCSAWRCSAGPRRRSRRAAAALTCGLRRLRRGGGCGCAAGGCGRRLPSKRQRRSRRRRARRNPRASTAGAAAGASAAGVVMTPSLPRGGCGHGHGHAGSPGAGASSRRRSRRGSADSRGRATVPFRSPFQQPGPEPCSPGYLHGGRKWPTPGRPCACREPPEIPSWLARAWSWASLRPARPLLLAGAAVDDPAAEDDVSTAEDSSVVSVTKDPSPSTASRLGAGRDDLIWAAVQICSRISALPDGYRPAGPDTASPCAFRK